MPTYNEAGNVERLAAGIGAALDPSFRDYEVVFVDDRSPDGTGEIVRRMARQDPRIRLLTKEKKEGIGAAHRAGFAAAQGRLIATIDADLSHDPADLLRMRDEIAWHGCDLVIGSRYVRGGRMIGKSWLRSAGSQGMNWLARLALGVPVRDATHTFRMFRREVYDRLRDKMTAKGHPAFEVEFTHLAAQNGFKLREVPIIMRERPGAGESKINVRKEAWTYLKFLWRLRFARGG